MEKHQPHSGPGTSFAGATKLITTNANHALDWYTREFSNSNIQPATQAALQFLQLPPLFININSNIIILDNMMRSLLLATAFSSALQGVNGYTFDPLQHLAGIAPYFEPEDPPLDPSPPQGCTVKRVSNQHQTSTTFLTSIPGSLSRASRSHLRQ